jgi:hypothetical protein
MFIYCSIFIYAIFGQLGILFNTPSTEDEVTLWQRSCTDGLHVLCIRRGRLLLENGKLSPRQTAIVYAHLASAYRATGQREAALHALEQITRIDPCTTELPVVLNPELTEAFQQNRQRVIQADRQVPVLLHIPPSIENFRNDSQFEVMATDNLKVREVRLYYRLKPSDAFVPLTFQHKHGNRYQVILPRKLWQNANTLHYYIEAEDCATNKARIPGANQEPFALILRSTTGSNAKTIVGSLLLAAGSAMLIGSLLSFISANSELERWYATHHLEQSEVIRESIILYHTLGWSGLGLGLISAGIGTYLIIPSRQTTKELTPPNYLKDEKKNAQVFSLWSNHCCSVSIDR